ncbi:ATP-dependent RNA helicase DRS1 [Zea mays]|uniref:ATP-dependent RNA helicase DRS1 n=1 Tax=Zea mays TaxID=4577 RepID=A0A1D6I8F4_MAIZE|nr:ATP-dependent RNA helicase DRS1 [Zea mays]
MDPSFRFDPDSSDDEASGAPARGRLAQSPWEFSLYAESVAAEHARRRTTSIDEKILHLRQGCGKPVLSDGSESDVSGSGEDDSNEKEIEEESGDEEDEREIEGVGDEEESGDREGGEEGGSELGEEKDAHEEEDTVEQNETSGPVDPSNFFASSEGATFHANSFLELNLSRPLVRACEALGYQKPTPIQAACIPLALTGRDICGSAITGSGKTAAFSLPVLERLLFRPKRVPAIRVLILTPTRELAAQVHSMIEKLAQFTDIRCCLIVGGLSTKVQEVALRSMPDIVVATPGRIIDHLRNSLSVGLEDLAVVILDEADRLLELGFSAEIQELIRMCPKRRQTMLFSATMTEEIDELIKLSLNKPVRLEADPSLKRPATLTEEVVRIRRARESNQEAVLLALCLKTFKRSVIIFSGTKQSAHRLKIIFGLSGMKAAELHGNLTQAQRLEALELFRKQEVDFLIATDVAARGIDIVGVQTVINFACPRDVKTYLHRVGRTARAGREGYAVTFVTDDDRSLLKAIAKKAGSQLKSRIVAEKPVAECAQLIEQLEDQISIIIREEKVEREARKAEMEIAKESLGQGKSTSGIISAKQAEDLRLKEKKRREHEKDLPRKKRRRLEAQREMLEDEDEDDEEAKESDRGKKLKKGQSLVDAAYRKAKSLKAASKRGPGASKGKKEKNARQYSEKTPNRHEEMRELFQNDMSEWKQGRSSKKNNNFAHKKSKAFNSKARYKRRK